MISGVLSRVICSQVVFQFTCMRTIKTHIHSLNENSGEIHFLAFFSSNHLPIIGNALRNNNQKMQECELDCNIISQTIINKFQKLLLIRTIKRMYQTNVI